MCFCFPLVVCDQQFFSELMKEASDVVGYFSSRVKNLLHLHIATGMQRYVLRLRQCFKDDRQALTQEGRILIEYIAMNAIAMRKILKKYDKVCISWDNFYLMFFPFHLHFSNLVFLGSFHPFLFYFRYTALWMERISSLGWMPNTLTFCTHLG